MNKTFGLCSGTLALVMAAVLSVNAQNLPQNQNPTPPRQSGDPIIRSLAGLIALHDAKSPQYRPGCLDRGCHDTIFNQSVQNSRIRPPHSVVEIMGIPPTACDFCHQSTQIVNGMKNGRGAAAVIGRNVDPVLRCFPCHGVAGPGKKLYAR